MISVIYTCFVKVRLTWVGRQVLMIVCLRCRIVIVVPLQLQLVWCLSLLLPSWPLEHLGLLFLAQYVILPAQTISVWLLFSVLQWTSCLQWLLRQHYLNSYLERLWKFESFVISLKTSCCLVLNSVTVMMCYVVGNSTSCRPTDTRSVSTGKDRQCHES